MRIVSPADEEEWREGVRTRMLVSACTEVPLALDPTDAPRALVDSTAALAAAVVQAARS